MSKPSTKQIIKSILFTSIAAGPAVAWFVNVRTPQSVLIALLTAFIGFALSLPGVSAKRVAGATAGAIVAKNVPRSMQDKVLDAFIDDEPSVEANDAKNDAA